MMPMIYMLYLVLFITLSCVCYLLLCLAVGDLDSNIAQEQLDFGVGLRQILI